MHHLLDALAVVVLRFTTASYGVVPDSLVPLGGEACLTVDSAAVQNIVACRLYRYACDGSDPWPPAWVREHSTVTAHDDTFQVPGEGCTNWWVTSVNSRGLESCLSNGVNIGTPLAVVQRPWHLLRRRGKTFDLQGRRVYPGRGLPSERYFGSDTLIIR